MVLSTCNRTEVYYASSHDLSPEIIKLMAIEKGFIATKNIQPFFRSLTNPEEAYKHLFHVALGLESQVTGDVQILNQVKTGLPVGCEENMAGPVLHRFIAYHFCHEQTRSKRNRFPRRRGFGFSTPPWNWWKN